jgi:large subunit ribosomal protein L10
LLLVQLRKSLCLVLKQGKDFFIAILSSKGRRYISLAFSKQQKDKLVAQYTDWIKQSQGVFILSYNKMTMKEIDALRSKIRESGGEIHVVKNTLMKLAMDQVGIAEQDVFDGSTIASFAFNDAPGLAKILTDASKSEIFAIKGGFLGSEVLTPVQVRSLADLPPLPVLRATLLGTLLAPASKLVRTLAEPARGLAAVIKARSEQEAAPAAA